MLPCGDRKFEDCYGDCIWLKDSSNKDICYNKYLYFYQKYCDSNYTLENEVEIKNILLEIGLESEEIDKAADEGNICQLLLRNILARQQIVKEVDEKGLWEKIGLSGKNLTILLCFCIVQLQYFHSSEIILQGIFLLLSNLVGKKFSSNKIKYISYFILICVVYPVFFFTTVQNFIVTAIFSSFTYFFFDAYYYFSDKIYTSVDRNKLFEYFNIENNNYKKYHLSFDVSSELLDIFNTTGYILDNVSDDIINYKKMTRVLLFYEAYHGLIDHVYEFKFLSDFSPFVKSEIPSISRLSPNSILAKIKQNEQLLGAKANKNSEKLKKKMEQILKKKCGLDEIPFKILSENLMNGSVTATFIDYKKIITLHRNINYRMVLDLVDLYYKSNVVQMRTNSFLVLQIDDQYYLLKGLHRFLAITIIKEIKTIPCDLIIFNSKSRKDHVDKIKEFFEIARKVRGIY